MGSWSNRKTPAWHAGDSGATPGDSTETNTVLWSSGEDTSYTQVTIGFESIRDHFGPDTPTGRAARLKPERLRVRLPLWALSRLGRQLADHLGLEPGMLWVRVPPEPLETIMSSWSSLECSPACHAGDRGFKSRRGRLSMKRHGTQIGKAAKLKPW